MSLNRYLYVFANPLKLTDFDGYDPELAENDERSWSYEALQGIADQIFLAGMGMPIAGYPWGKYNSFGDYRQKDEKGRDQYHPAIDAGGREGTDIYATYPGRVVQVIDGTDDEMSEVYFGRKVVIEHTVLGVKLYSTYVHLASVSVQVGDMVNKSTVIGGMGNSGRLLDGMTEMPTHLHYEVRTSLYVDQDKKGNISLSTTPESYWANSYEELNQGWVDLGPIFGYHSTYPTAWPKRPPVKR